MAQRKNNQQLVLSVLTQSTKPLTAYQILEHLQHHGVTAPPTVYRALNALQLKGFVHRLQSLNAFVACHKTSHMASFMLCQDCGTVQEIYDDRMHTLLKEWGDKLAFAITQPMIEILGICHQCTPEKSNTQP